MSVNNQCEQCHAALPPDAVSCPECGHDGETPEQAGAGPRPQPRPKPELRPWAHKPFADAAVTQYIEIPPGGFPPPAHPADPPDAPKAEKTDRSAIAVAVSLGLLAGLLVILVLVGIACLQRTPKITPGAASAHASGLTPAR